MKREGLCCQTLQALKLTYHNPVTPKSKFYAAISSVKHEISFKNYARVNNDVRFHMAVKFQLRLGRFYIGHALNAEDGPFAPETLSFVLDCKLWGKEQKQGTVKVLQKVSSSTKRRPCIFNP